MLVSNNVTLSGVLWMFTEGLLDGENEDRMCLDVQETGMDVGM